MSIVKYASVFLLLVLTGTQALTANETSTAYSQPMTAVDLISVPVVSQPKLSASGKQILFTITDVDWKKDRRISHVWRQNTDGTGLVKMTNGAGGEDNALWSPDGQTIAFRSKRADDKKNQIYLIPNTGGEAVRLTNHKTNVGNLAWAVDGSGLYFLADDDRTALEKERKAVKDDMIRFDDDKPQQHLWFVNRLTGDTTQITKGDFYVRNYSLSPDGSKIVHDRAPTSLLDDRWHSELWVMDANGTGAVRITSNEYPESGARLSPDNSQVLFRAGVNGEGEPYYNDNLFIASADGKGQQQLMLEDMPYEIDAAEWGKSGKIIYFVANMGVHTELFELTVEKSRVKQLTNGDHAIRDWHYERNRNSHIFGLATATNPGDLWSMDNKARLTRVSRLYDSMASVYRLPRVEAIRWKSDDGVEVEGLLYYPIDYSRGKRYPLVVQTHGGPLSSDKFGSFSYGRYAQVLTGRGYAVLQPNYRGSVGYGDDFARDMVGGYFTNAHLDVMTGVDAVIDMGLADPDKLIKMGWSAGGHLTNKIITHTDRFKAASSGAGAVNWISMYGQSDVRINRTPWFGNTPWVEGAPIDVYWNNSPLKDIWKVKTPTLVLVGEKDVRVPPPQSVELHRALKFNGVPTKLYMAPGEPHGWRKPSHRLFKVNVELDWFENYVFNRAYTWEKAPKDKENDKEKQTKEDEEEK